MPSRSTKRAIKAIKANGKVKNKPKAAKSGAAKKGKIAAVSASTKSRRGNKRGKKGGKRSPETNADDTDGQPSKRRKVEETKPKAKGKAAARGRKGKLDVLVAPKAKKGGRKKGPV